MQETERAITVALLAFSENFRKEVSVDLKSVWMNTLGELSMDAVQTGTRRCLTECEFFPTISVFLEKTKQNDLAGQWKHKQQIEYTHPKIGMPADVKEAVAILMREASQSKVAFVPFRTVYGSENGLNFKISQDTEGRDFVEYTNRPAPSPTFMRRDR